MSGPEGERTEFDDYSADYDEHVNKALVIPGLKVDYFTQVKAAYILDLLKGAYGTSEVSVLDIGCGVGNYHKLLRPQLRDLAGIDVSRESVAEARKRHPSVDYETYDGTNVPYPEERFDAAFAICVYHHIPLATRPVLTRDVARVLKPGGLFMIFEHNPRNPLTMRVVNRCEFDRDAILLRPHEAEGLMGGAGFDDVASRHILTVPSFNSVTRGVDLAFSRLPLGAQYYTTGRRARL
tara:strand:+ start:4044 stop:4754 length:711 start_codon:yes stop_codon:yes gene_type:complete